MLASLAAPAGPALGASQRNTEVAVRIDAATPECKTPDEAMVAEQAIGGGGAVPGPSTPHPPTLSQA